MKLWPALACAAFATTAAADPTAGVDSALFRGAYDANGLFSLEGARLLPRHDLSYKVLVDYAQAPMSAAVPGIGAALGDRSKDHILDYLVTVDMAFGLAVSERVAIGLDVAAYRTAVGSGYGARGSYTKPSTGLVSLRPLSNIDPSASPSSASYQADELAGPLDAHLGIKLGLYRDPHLAVAAIGSLFLPFGDEDMLLGDRSLVFEPRLAAEWRPDAQRATRVLANVAARLRQRSVLEAYDTSDPNATAADAKAFLDVGSEAIAGLGAVYELSPRTSLAAEAQAFVPLPAAAAYGSCRLYSGATCDHAMYWPGAKRGDFTTLATAGLLARISADVTANLLVGTGQGGGRGDTFHITTGLVWAPQPAGALRPGAGDRDGDGIPDSVDGCVDDPEDKDGFQDDDGCPDPDNDGDGIPDGRDKCPNEPEDRDGFQDEDGCPDPDNDGDGILDGADKCPNDPEDKDGFEDEDGCPDVHVSSGPEERADRIDIKGQPITFGRDGKPTPAGKTLLAQVAAIIKAKKLTIRVEVHVPLGTKSTNAAQIAAQKRQDKALSQKRAQAIVDALVTQGVASAQLQAVGLGADASDRVDFIKTPQRAP